MDVGLVTDVKKKMVGRRVKDPVQGDRQLHHAQVRAEVSTGLTQDLNELFQISSASRGRSSTGIFFTSWGPLMESSKGVAIEAG